ncbi:uncharacterized protein LOC121374854 [Gigantopelta aegis]|uniref:uncharacterized protein LOC121374854 n=1 Tax=Gigantopelta aegis TaxID=1735272 RepID=UPI001B888AD0|nr:uncharacterized protein LOC121374854 [Gigantopelta aegis]
MAFTRLCQHGKPKSSPTVVQSLVAVFKENRLPSGGLTRFAHVLLNVATNLTKDEYAVMKLALVASDGIQAKQVDGICCAADLLSFMYLKKFINKDNVNLLMELLVKIQRIDLYDAVCSYQQGEKPGSCITQQQKEVSADSSVIDEQCSCVKEKTKDFFSDSMEDDLDLPNSQNSQSSLSDDDKISQLEKQKMVMESSTMDTSSQ